MTRPIRHLAAIGFGAALALLVTSASLAGAHAMKAQQRYVKPHFALHATIVVKSDEQRGKKGPDGKWHDAFLPGDFRVLAGVPVRITVVNYDDVPHSFTSPTLHLNKIVPAAKGAKPGKVTFTFTAKRAGTYLWWCATPCDPWAMRHSEYMRGYVKAVA